ncbi:MAG: outer membrane lipoprotein-sorting protein [Oligoflexia bacterium]|nr:outer membrane lipoprotein-sorting protein [Oligoflexia bacterium]
MNKILALALSLFLFDRAWAISAREVMVKNEEVRQIQDVQAVGVLTTGGGDSTQRVKEFTWWRKLHDGTHFNTLTKFHKPAEIRNQGILFLEKAQDATDVQMYLPTYKKIRRIETGQQSGSFMGSEFSYSDISTPHVDDYTYKMLGEAPCAGEAKVNCYNIEALPAKDSIKERTGTSKAVLWVRADNFMIAKGDYFDKEGSLWKQLESSKIEKVDAAKNKWMALHLKMTNAKTKKFTDLKFSNVKVNVGIQDSVFTNQSLQKEK